jgi:hypothetical protein
MRNRRNIVGIASISLLLCCIAVLAVLWLLGPRIANHYGKIWQDTLPDHAAYSGRIYASAYPDKCVTPGDGLIQVGSIPAIFGASAPLFAAGSNGNSLVMGVYVQKNVGCYILYEIEGGP